MNLILFLVSSIHHENLKLDKSFDAVFHAIHYVFFFKFISFFKNSRQNNFNPQTHNNIKLFPRIITWKRIYWTHTLFSKHFAIHDWSMCLLFFLFFFVWSYCYSWYCPFKLITLQAVISTQSPAQNKTKIILESSIITLRQAIKLFHLQLKHKSTGKSLLGSTA